MTIKQQKFNTKLIPAKIFCLKLTLCFLTHFRFLMKPIMEPEPPSQSAVSLAAFPKDINPLTVVFGTGSGGTTSRRSSKRDSYISLYDNPSPDDWFTAAAQAAAMTAGSVGLTPTSANPHRREMRTGSFSKAFWSVGSLNKLCQTDFMFV